jgi:tripartite-type tricarboxylate transporter receptor subunit TctC
MISLVTEIPITLAVRANNPIQDIPGLIAYAKANPGKLTFASGGVGTGNHMAGELLKKMAGIDMLHVPFRGTAPALTSLYAGDIDLLFVSTIEAVPHARDGRIRVLGVGTPHKVPELPNSPPIADTVPGYSATNWYGLFGPRGLPPAIVARLGAELPKVREDATVKERSAVIGMPMLLTPPEVLRARVEAEVPRWKQLITSIGLKLN